MNIFKKEKYENLNIIEDGTIQFESNMDLGNLDLSTMRKFYLTRIGGISPLTGILNFKIKNEKKYVKINFDYILPFDDLEIFRINIYDHKNNKVELEMKVPKGRGIKLKKKRSLSFKKYSVFNIYKKN